VRQFGVGKGFQIFYLIKPKSALEGLKVRHNSAYGNAIREILAYTYALKGQLKINCSFRAQMVVFVHYTGRCPVLNYVALSARPLYHYKLLPFQNVVK